MELRRQGTCRLGRRPETHIDETFSAFADLDFRFWAWRGRAGTNVFAPERGKGSQFYAPLSLGLTYERADAVRIETKVMTGFASARHNTVGKPLMRWSTRKLRRLRRS